MMKANSRIVLAADHGGFALKEKIKTFLLQKRLDFIDTGAFENDPLDDFPLIAKRGVEKILENGVGIFICGSGIGISIAANRTKGIRAALCHSAEYARLARQHNNANVLCLGGRFAEFGEVEKIVETFLETEFLGGKYQTRMDMLDN